MGRHIEKAEKQSGQMKDGLLFYPWEKTFDRIVTPFEEFIEKETTSGLLLIIFTSAALILANSPFKDLYDAIIHSHIAITMGPWTLDRSLLHWINEGLMVFFFFVVGLEIKREILIGELSDIRSAALPIIAAMGGMIVPALIYRLMNPSGISAVGWGIPMATDIAFSVSVLVIIGRRIPQVLMVLLVAMAIVDDLGAVLVIAVFYTKEIDYQSLIGAGVVLMVLVVLNLSGVRRGIAYFLAGLILWFFLLFSGIHATVAGVLVALCIPAHGRYDPEAFEDRLHSLATRFAQTTRDRPTILGDTEKGSVLNVLSRELHLARPPLQHLIDSFHLPVALLVIPLFALANGGITLKTEAIAHALTTPVTQGVMAGLLLGKVIGVSLFSWLAIRSGLALLPTGVTIPHIIGIGFICGIGFTMSIFISEISFNALPEFIMYSKTGIVFGSLASGLFGVLWLMAISLFQKIKLGKGGSHDSICS